MAAVGDEAALVRFRHVTEDLRRRDPGREGPNLDIRRGEVLDLARAFGLRQDDLADDARRASRRRRTARSCSAGRELGSTRAAYKRNIGMVFQNYALFPHMTVVENVAFPLSVRRVGKAEQQARAAKALAMVKLDRLGGRRPAQLSGGQQQRVALGARAGLRADARADGRTARRARQAVARAHAARDQAHPSAPRRHRGLRDARPERGADDVRPHRRVQRRHGAAARHAERACTTCPRNSFVASFIGENNKLHGVVEALEDGEVVPRAARQRRDSCKRAPSTSAASARAPRYRSAPRRCTSRAPANIDANRLRER